MNLPRTKDFVNQYGALILIAIIVALLHFLTNNQYGFHRDELPLFDDARDLNWGYVAYPPVTPLITRIAIELFGTSLAAIHVIPTLVQAFILIIIGLMARELGGNRLAQVMTMIAVITSGRVLSMGGRMDYVTFDYLWWVLVAYFMLRLLNSANPRWWLAIGMVIGLGMMTKYTMAVWAAALVGGVLLTETRHYLKSPYLWGGAGLSLLIFLPNLLWQIEHDFISLDFLSSIHERDIEWGRTDGFLPEQFLICTNPPTVPFWIAGLYFYFFRPEGRKYRLLGWMYVIALVLLFTMRGRSYYLVGAYPPLMAAGMVFFEKMVNSLSVPKHASRKV